MSTIRPSQLSVSELLSDDDRYIIPMYQRNYAWEEGEISQLIQDVADNLPSEKRPLNKYYIGSLVVYQRQNPHSHHSLYETIDGQQRLTTLTLLASYLRHKKVTDLKIPQGKLSFDSRESSTHTVDTIQANNYSEKPEQLLDEEKTNNEILNGFNLISKHFTKNEWSDAKLSCFTDYLLNHVQIIRVKVPDDTDLNHYFEIMNNRGEQLEKHEILKALMLRTLESMPNSARKDAAKLCLQQVWEASSNMEKYIQMGFSVSMRFELFGQDWSSFIPGDSASLLEYFSNRENKSPGNESKESSLENILKNTKGFIKEEGSGSDQPAERFHPAVNFQNFLLHVLKVHTREDIPLDDKRLIPTFSKYLLKRGPEQVIEFTYALLKAKWLFDHYIIKRDYAEGADDWSLKHLRKSDGQNSSYYRNTFADGEINQRILMLLTAFHVSTPTMVYKHWLNAALHYLYQSENDIKAEGYLDYLESTAKAFVFDRYLAREQQLNYYEIIFQNSGQCQTNTLELAEETIASKLTFGKIENNLIFNYLDYLLWLNLKGSGSKKLRDFKFTFRSSVEHYYPQNPETIPTLDDSDQDAFGNLCLISHSKNSRLSNFPPEAKKANYQPEHVPIDSIKQHLMMEDTPPWSAKEIQRHTSLMIQTLKTGLFH